MDEEYEIPNFRYYLELYLAKYILRFICPFILRFIKDSYALEIFIPKLRLIIALVMILLSNNYLNNNLTYKSIFMSILTIIFFYCEKFINWTINLKEEYEVEQISKKWKAKKAKKAKRLKNLYVTDNEYY